MDSGNKLQIEIIPYKTEKISTGTMLGFMLASNNKTMPKHEANYAWIQYR